MMMMKMTMMGRPHVGLVAEEDGVLDDEAPRRNDEDEDHDHLHTNLQKHIQHVIHTQHEKERSRPRTCRIGTRRACWGAGCVWAAARRRLVLFEVCKSVITTIMFATVTTTINFASNTVFTFINYSQTVLRDLQTSPDACVVSRGYTCSEERTANSDPTMFSRHDCVNLPMRERESSLLITYWSKSTLSS